MSINQRAHPHLTCLLAGANARRVMNNDLQPSLVMMSSSSGIPSMGSLLKQVSKSTMLPHPISINKDVKRSAFTGRGDGIFYCLTPRTRSTFPLCCDIVWRLPEQAEHQAAPCIYSILLTGPFLGVLFAFCLVTD